MRRESPANPRLCTPEEIDEAAVWIARLHAPDRTLQVERGFRRWLAEKPSRREAFDIVSSGWELAGMLQSKPFPGLSRWERAGFREGFLRASLAVAATALIVFAVSFFRNDGVATDVGEQRVVTLEDGTRITLNTSTRIVTHYDEHVRRVELRSGEALFEVARKDATWPFVVVAGGRTITALGTSFLVREDGSGTSVVLVEGKVVVADSATRAGETKVLSPGQRLTFVRDEVSLDEPVLEKVTAWRWGQVEFEETPLAAAVAEMNRYSETKLSVASRDAEAIRINGVFRTGDTANFAAAVAQTYGLTATPGPHEIVLDGAPAMSPHSSP